ncbi:hypothetical protein MSAN_02383600 [Mycena sanguinolenta]|uniref:Uncharacterized protein n=1 Tax=Mycena sanguinolenta TaxID=230812 RepID=A0A8H6X4J7_9AGAR|nr:hypothetical protein MSAN_02383600 [Mycena sanguinolenta]
MQPSPRHTSRPRRVQKTAHFMISILSSSRTMDSVIDAASLDYAWSQILYNVSQTCSVLVLYAVYIILFFFSLYTIVRRNSNGRRFMVVTSSGMFLLGTMNMLVTVLSMTIEIHLIKAEIQGKIVDTARLARLYNNLAAASDLCLITNNALTDLLLLYHCYTIWGSRKTVLILPAVFAVATCLLGYFTVASDNFADNLPFLDQRADFAMSGATNTILMCLTAGRIWYMRRESRQMKGNTFYDRYRTVIAMIVESGALYNAIILLGMIALSLNCQSDAVTVFQGICHALVIQMVNITPTLIFVRVGMGYCRLHQDSAPMEVRIPGMRTPRRQEDGFLEHHNAEAIKIKRTGV